MNTLVVAKVIVVNDAGEILLIRRSKDDARRPLEWDVPGGFVESGEYQEEAAAREALEETGIEVDPHSLNILYAMTEVPRDGLSVTWVFSKIHVGSPEITLSSEHEEYVWLSLEKAISSIDYERQQRVLKYIATNDLLRSEPVEN